MCCLNCSFFKYKKKKKNIPEPLRGFVHLFLLPRVNFRPSWPPCSSQGDPSLSDCEHLFRRLSSGPPARGQRVESRWKWTRERLISCERCCQRGPERAVWSFCQRVSHFHGPHCGPLSCPWLDLNGPFDGPFIAHLSAEHGGPRGVRVAQHLARVCKNRVRERRQNKSHSVKRLLEINFL